MGGFHSGELAVQERAGVRQLAQRLSPMLAPPDLSGGAGRFLAGRDLAVITARGQDGRLWTSPLVARPGFLAGHNASLHVNALPHKGDPLHDLPAGQQVGMVAIDFENANGAGPPRHLRRRVSPFTPWTSGRRWSPG